MAPDYTFSSSNMTVVTQSHATLKTSNPRGRVSAAVTTQQSSSAIVVPSATPLFRAGEPRPKYVKIYFDYGRKNRLFPFDSMLKHGNLTRSKLLSAVEQLPGRGRPSQSSWQMNVLTLCMKDRDASSMTVLLNDDDIRCALGMWKIHRQDEAAEKAVPSNRYLSLTNQDRQEDFEQNNKHTFNVYLKYEA